MGRKRWAERRQSSTAAVVMGTDTAPPVGLFTADRPGVIRCGHPYGDGSMCMAPASEAHSETHAHAVLAEEVGLPLEPWQERALEFMAAVRAGGISHHVLRPTRFDWHKTPPTIAAEEQERRETEELLNRADRMIPAKGLAKVVAEMPWPVVVDESLPPMSFRFGTPTTKPTYDVLKAASAERAQFTTEQAQTMLSAALGTRPHLAARVIDKLGPVLAGELARAVDGAVNDRIGRYLADEKAELNRIYTDQSTKLKAEREQRGRDVNAERWETPSRLA